MSTQRHNFTSRAIRLSPRFYHHGSMLLMAQNLKIQNLGALIGHTQFFLFDAAYMFVKVRKAIYDVMLAFQSLALSSTHSSHHPSGSNTRRNLELPTFLTLS